MFRHTRALSSRHAAARCYAASRQLFFFFFFFFISYAAVDAAVTRCFKALAIELPLTPCRFSPGLSTPPLLIRATPRGAYGAAATCRRLMPLRV